MHDSPPAAPPRARVKGDERSSNRDNLAGGSSVSRPTLGFDLASACESRAVEDVHALRARGLDKHITSF